ncbi:hypothetical protein [Plantactinospora sp. GCM10030261]|uniref:hypothetical protein n=1 Tax=Plantactinospora sp. GCM10030261 TaxID=3273420 RepID=UPI00362458B5
MAINDHSWRTRSRHHSVDGTVRYQSCHCGAWRVVLVPDEERILADAIGSVRAEPGSGGPVG